MDVDEDDYKHWLDFLRGTDKNVIGWVTGMFLKNWLK
jgi:hypothetical protein